MALQPVRVLLGGCDHRYLLVWLFLVSLLLSLLAACNLATVSPQSQSPSPSGQILIWHSYDPATDIAKSLRADLDKYQQLYPTIRVVSEYILPQEFPQRFIEQVQSGLGPDLLLNFAQTIPSLVAADVLQPVPDSIDLSPYLPKVLQRIRYQGKLYGVPWSLQTQVLCYNQQQLQPGPPPDPISPASPTAPAVTQPVAQPESASPDGAMPLTADTDPALLQPPTTLAELLQQARAGYPVGLVSNLVQTWWGTTSFGGQLLDAQGHVVPKLNGWARWLEWLQQASAVPNVMLNSNPSLLHEAFARGQLTYYVCDSTEIPQLKARLGEQLRVALLPGEPARPAQPLVSARVLLFSQSSSQAQTRLAADLAQFLTNQAQQANMVLTVPAFIPINTGVKLDLRFFPIASILVEQVKISRLMFPIDAIESVQRILQQGESLYDKVMTGTMKPSEVASELSQLLHQAFDGK
jgi:ABC-type glycerol-3-phosphate transport system substrate-binding protein